MKIQTPFEQYRDRVRPEWIDHNQHMNMGYYLVVLDFATDAWLDYIGLTQAHRKQHDITTFCLEAHITYQRELVQGDPLRFTTLLLNFDEKRIHYFHEMQHAGEGYLAATNELISLHISKKTRRAAPMPDQLLHRLETIKKHHDSLPRPPQLGRIIGLDAKPTTRPDPQ